MNRFVFTEPASCIGCRTCEVACALAHQESREKVLKQRDFLPRLQVVMQKEVSSTVQCRHCEDAPCVNVCPTGALVYSKSTVQLIAKNCIGCKTCVIACPYGAMAMIAKPVRKSIGGGITVNDVQFQALKCDLCAGSADGPACIQACPTKAIHLMGSDAVDALSIAGSEYAAHKPAAGSVN